jgi:hypothetical protein
MYPGARRRHRRSVASRGLVLGDQSSPDGLELTPTSRMGGYASGALWVPNITWDTMRRPAPSARQCADHPVLV